LLIIFIQISAFLIKVFKYILSVNYIFLNIYIKGHMISVRRLCIDNPNVFCYKWMTNKENTTTFVKQAYHVYFAVRLGDQDKSWASHNVFKTYVKSLRQWEKGKRKCLKFGIQMIWRHPKNHNGGYYLCVVNMKGFNRHKTSKWVYPDLK